MEVKMAFRTDGFIFFPKEKYHEIRSWTRGMVWRDGMDTLEEKC